MNSLRNSLKIMRASYSQLSYRRKIHGGGSLPSKLLTKHLLLVNSVTSGAFMMIGDLVQQEIEFRSEILPKRYDWIRNLKMLCVGLVFGPVHHFYYVYLDKVVKGNSLRNVWIKIAMDQLVAAPLTYIAFFATMTVLEWKTVAEGVADFKDKIWAFYLGDCIFWPPVQFINFYYLSTKWRVIYINCATMVFNVYISYVKFCDKEKLKNGKEQ